MGSITATLMAGIEIADRSTIADNQIFESPFITENLLKQSVAATTGVIVEPLIGTHHLADVGFLDGSLESRHIGFPKITG